MIQAINALWQLIVFDKSKFYWLTLASLNIIFYITGGILNGIAFVICVVWLFRNDIYEDIQVMTGRREFARLG